MTPVYLCLSDLSARAREDIERVAWEWFGGYVWGQWGAPPDVADRDELVLPLHLGAGADLGVRVLARWLGKRGGPTAPGWFPYTNGRCNLDECDRAEDEKITDCRGCPHHDAPILGWVLGYPVVGIHLWCSTEAGGPPERTMPTLAGITDPTQALLVALLAAAPKE